MRETRFGARRELREDVAKTAAEDRRWLAGPVLLAVIDLRLKKPIDATAAARPLLDAPGSDYGLMNARWFFGLELEGVPEYRNVAADLFKAAVSAGRSYSQFEYSPVNSLLQNYKQQGRKEEGREFLRHYIANEMNGSYSTSLPSIIRVNSLIAIAKLLDDFDAPADAVRLYCGILSNPALIDGSSQIVVNGQLGDARQHVTQALTSVLNKRQNRAEDVIALLTPLEKPRPGAPAIVSSGFVGGTGIMPGGTDPERRSIAELTARLRQLAVIWKQHQFPAATVSQLFERLVFPPDRPGEIVFFEVKMPSMPVPRGFSPPALLPRTVPPSTTLQSIDRMLIEWAIRGERVEELKREIAARQATPADIDRGHLLLCQLHIDRREPDLARPHWEALQATLDKAKLAALQKQIEQAAAPAKNP